MMWNGHCADVMRGWLVAADEARMRQATVAAPYLSRLLGREILLWLEDDSPRAATREGQALRVQRAYGHYWICPSGEPERSLFDFPEVSELGWRTVACGGIGVATSPARVVENFLDMGHFPFIHEGYLGATGHTEVPAYRLRSDAENDELWAEGCTFWQPTNADGGKHGGIVHYRYRTMHPCASILYKSPVSPDEMQTAIGLFVQPCDETRVIVYILLALRQSSLGDAELIARQHHIFGQDKPILENHVPARVPLKGSAETPARCDAMSVSYRRWLGRRGFDYGTD